MPRSSGGCRGTDGVTIDRFAKNLEQELDHLEDRLRSQRYHFFPLLRFEVPKAQHGVRCLAVPTVRDRVAQTAAYSVSPEPLEAEFEECSYAFRPGRSVKGAIRRVDELRHGEASSRRRPDQPGGIATSQWPDALSSR